MKALGVGRRIALATVAVLATGATALVAVPVGADDEHFRPDYGHGAALTGAAEVPGPGDPDGAGLAKVALHPGAGRACLELEVADIAAPTLAHIHAGTSDVAGPVVVDFTPTLTGDDCVEGVDAALLRAIRANPAAYYVNVHNPRFPAGAIRGQVFERGGLPDEVAIPPGFQPEGIDIARHDGTFLVGSLRDGSIYLGDLATGRGDLIVEPREGGMAVGLERDGDRLWVAGGATGTAHAYQSHTGEELGSWALADPTTGPTFINDVVKAGDTAWFTDSMRPVLYGVRLGEAEVTTLPLTGDLVFQEGFNTNGIEATEDGKVLVVVQSNTGSLFAVDPATGVTRKIDLGGETVANGDGLTFHDGHLYVVQNLLNRIAKVDLADDLATGTVVAHLTDPDLDIPTTVAAYGGRLWAVNARFFTTPEPTTYYSVVSVRG